MSVRQEQLRYAASEPQKLWSSPYVRSFKEDSPTGLEVLWRFGTVMKALRWSLRNLNMCTLGLEVQKQLAAGIAASATFKDARSQSQKL